MLEPSAGRPRQLALLLTVRKRRRLKTETAVTGAAAPGACIRRRRRCAGPWLVLLPLTAALALSGCGAHHPSVADCLNTNGFLVQEHDDVVRGSSAAGVNFTLSLYSRRQAALRAFDGLSRASSALIGDAVVDFAGNPAGEPGGLPGRLSRTALATIARCLDHP
jgi:hypothetical protein